MIKGKLALALGIIEGIIIVALIVFIVTLLNKNTNVGSTGTIAQNVTNNAVNETMADTITRDSINSERVKNLLNMTDAELVNYAYNINVEQCEGFSSLEEKKKDYKFGKCSANTFSEAVKELYDCAIHFPNILGSYGEITEEDINKAELVDETDYYYAIKLEYTIDGEITEGIYIVFKKSIFDYTAPYFGVGKQAINFNQANTNEKVKRIMDLYTMLQHKEMYYNPMYPQKIFDPTLVEKEDCFEYTYYQLAVYDGGDPTITDTTFTVKQRVYINKVTIEIDKKDGQIGEEQYQDIRTLEGKTDIREIPYGQQDDEE